MVWDYWSGNQRRKRIPLLVQLYIGQKWLYLDLKGEESQVSIKLNYYNKKIFLSSMKKNANNQVTLIFIVLLKEETTPKCSWMKAEFRACSARENYACRKNMVLKTGRDLGRILSKHSVLGLFLSKVSLRIGWPLNLELRDLQAMRSKGLEAG